MADPSRQFVAYDTSTGEGVLSDGKRLPVDDTMVPGVTKLPAPGATPAATQLLQTLGGVTQKLDTPAGAAPLGAPAPARSVTTQTTRQQGLAPGSVAAGMAPVATAENAYADEALGAATEQHDQRSDLLAQRKTDVLAEQQRAKAEAEDAKQRAEIARLNEGAIAAQQDPTLDPHRLVSSMSTGTKLLTVLLSALGGAGAAVSGQRNAALDSLGKAIDDDIGAQKEQIASGRIRRGNLVNYFREQGMSNEAAAAAAKGVLVSNAEKLVDIEAQNLGNDVALSNAKLLKPQLAAAREKANAELKLQLEGQRGSSTTTTSAPAQAGAGLTTSDALKELLARRDVASLQGTGLTHDEYSTQATKYSEQAKLNDDIVERAAEVVTALGGRIEEQKDSSGKVVGMKVVGELDEPHFGTEGTAYETAISNLKRADVMGMSREPSRELQDEFAKATEMPFRDANKAVKLQKILDMAMKGRKDIQGGYNPNVVTDVDGLKHPGGNAVLPYREVKKK